MARALHILPAAALLVGLCWGASATADPLPEGAQQAFLTVVVNADAQGDRLVAFTADGAAMVKLEDLADMGIQTNMLGAAIMDVEGERWVDLERLAPNVHADLDLEAFELKVDVPASYLQRHTISARRQERTSTEVGTPVDSAFLNYTGSAQCIDMGWSCPLFGHMAAGTRLGGGAFYSDARWEHPSRGFVRGMTWAAWDDQDARSRLQLGDVRVRGANLGSQGVITGGGVWTEYAVDPGFVRYTLPPLLIEAQTPSDLAVYVNGRLMMRRSVPAGPVQLNDLKPTLGQGEVEVRLTDAYGDTRVVRRPWYQPASLLAPGVSERGVFVGFTRPTFGDENWSWGEPAAVGRFRRGFEGGFALGVSGELTPSIAQASADGTLVLFDAAALSLDLASSHGPRGTGGAARAAVETGGDTLSFGVNGTWATSAYSTATAPRAPWRRAGRLHASVAIPSLGTLSTDVGVAESQDRGGSLLSSAWWNTRLVDDLNLRVRLAWTEPLNNAGPAVTEGTLALGWNFGGGVMATAQSEVDSASASASRVRVNASPHDGRGPGGSATFSSRRTQQGQEVDAADLRGSWRGTYGNLDGGVAHNLGGFTVYSASASGGLVFIDGGLYATRPVHDAYGVVETGAPDVPVYRANREVGLTDGEGRLMVPDLLSYQDNRVSIDVDALPMDLNVLTHEAVVSPAFKGGVRIDFPVDRLQALVGVFTGVGGDGRVHPVALSVIEIEGPDGELVPHPTGTGGEFYLEHVEPGAHQLQVRGPQRRWTCDIEVPVTDEVIIDLKEVRCEPIR